MYKANGISLILLLVATATLTACGTEDFRVTEPQDTRERIELQAPVERELVPHVDTPSVEMEKQEVHEAN